MEGMIGKRADNPPSVAAVGDTSKVGFSKTSFNHRRIIRYLIGRLLSAAACSNMNEAVKI